MSRTRIVLMLAGLAVVLLVAVALGVGHNDETSYPFKEIEHEGRPLQLYLQNTGGMERFLGLFALRRYAAPFELHIQVDVPDEALVSVTLSDVELRHGEERILYLEQVVVPFEEVEILQGGRWSTGSSAWYQYPELLQIGTELVVLSGSVRYGDELEEHRFRAELEPTREKGFYLRY